MSIHLDHVPKDKQRRREIVNFLVNARHYPPHSILRDFWKTFCRGMCMAYWNDDNRHLFKGFEEGVQEKEG